MSPEAMVLSTMHTPFIMVQLRKFWAGSPRNHSASTPLSITKAQTIDKSQCHPLYVFSALYFQTLLVTVSHLILRVGTLSSPSPSSSRAKRTEAQSKFIIQARSTQIQVS